MFDTLSLVVFLAALTTSGVDRWRARQVGETIARRREHPVLVACRAIVALPLVVIIVANGLSAGWTTWAKIPLPAWMRWLGLAMGIGIMPVVFWVFRFSDATSARRC